MRCFIILTPKHIIKVVKSRRVGNVTLVGKEKIGNSVLVVKLRKETDWETKEDCISICVCGVWTVMASSG